MKLSRIIGFASLLYYASARVVSIEQLDQPNQSFDISEMEPFTKSLNNGDHVDVDIPVPIVAVSSAAHFNVSWNPAANSSHPLHIRAVWEPPAPASEQLWTECVCRGRKLLQSMLGTAQYAGSLYVPSRPTSQSPIQNIIESLQTWGWAAYNALEVNSFYRGFDDFFGIGDALRGLGYSDKTTDRGGKWKVKYLSHGHFQNDWTPDTTPYVVTGRSYRPTFGKFVYGANPQEGALLALDMLGPRQAGRRWGIPREEWPEIFRHSDVLWAIWKMIAEASNNLKNLKHHLSVDIVNIETQAVISRILQETGQQLEPYPGVSFQTDTVYGQALLGSPNGSGFGYMLVEHKQELGNKYVHYMNIFSCSTNWRRPCMAIWVYDNNSAKRSVEDLGDS